MTSTQSSFWYAGATQIVIVIAFPFSVPNVYLSYKRSSVSVHYKNKRITVYALKACQFHPRPFRSQYHFWSQLPKIQCLLSTDMGLLQLWGKGVHARSEYPMKLVKLKQVKGRVGLEKGSYSLQLLARVSTVHLLQPLLSQHSPSSTCPFWQELHGQVLGDWHIPDHLQTRNGGEKRMGIFSPPLAWDPLEDAAVNIH